MLILLPNEDDGLAALERRLSGDLLEDVIASMGYRTISLFVPRFTFTWGTDDVGPALAALGMPRAFHREAADFSGINGLTPPHKEALFLSSVFHRAFVDVNEAGTEAAAATALIHDSSSPGAQPPPIPIVRADHHS